MRAVSHAVLALLWSLCWLALVCEASPQRQQLVGAWRLVAMEYVGPQGGTVDPFYQPASTGLLVYDKSGWMSVHISGPGRQTWEVPAARAPGSAGSEDRLKAAAFDSYYSYYGTWEYDAGSSVVTHHVESSLIPAETGLNYAQHVTLEAGRLVFTTQSGPPGARTLRKKVWQRLGYAN